MIITRNGIYYELVDCNAVRASKDGEILGYISINEGDWELIENGADPIEDDWEDGLGNPLSEDGWGEYAK